MKVIDKELVIIGSNEYCEINGRFFFRSGLESQMEYLASYFKNCYHYSPQSEYVFHGYEFTNHVNIHPFSFVHHRSHLELWNRRREYFKSIKKIFNNHKDAIFMVHIPDSYIGLISALYLKKVNAKWFARITSDHLKEMKVRRNNSMISVCAYYIVRPIYIVFMKWLLKGIFQVYTGNKIFYTNDLSYSVNSTNLTLADIKERASKYCAKQVNLLYVGRFDKYKGVDVLIKSLNFLNSKNFCLYVIGFDNPMNEQYIRNNIAHSKQKHKIKFIGHVPYGTKLFKYYDMADVLIVPSLYETQGKTPLEAMARGVCVIATNVGGLPNIVKNQYNGILVEPNDPLALAVAMDTVINDELLRKKLVFNGYEMVKNNTIDHIGEVIIGGINKHLLERKE